MPIKEGGQEGKAVVTNEDTVHTADGSGSGDAKVAQTRPRKSESAHVVPRTKQKKDLRRKQKG